MKVITAVLCALLLAVLGSSEHVAAAGTCADLSRFALPHTMITMAQAVEAGVFTPPGAAANERPRALPAFCRVAATLTPTSDSDIKIEVWLPASGWNGKFLAVGNGAFNGSIAYPAMSTALARGYATASTDTGHDGNTGRFGLGHPEKVIDFGWRAVHEMAETSKKIVAAYYASAPARAYWSGCSAGGREALVEAQRFPSDFDGIIAGAPGLDWTGRAAQAVRIAARLEGSEGARLPEAARTLLHRAVVDACDAIDGVKDGLIQDPTHCRFDPGVLECKGAANGSCLTSAQVETVRLIYSSPTNPKTSRAIPGLLPGSELGWTDLGWTASARATGLDQFRYLVFADPKWTTGAFRFESDLARAEDADGGTINALDPNLKPFLDRGGKLIQYHGWSDPQISPAISTQYYSRVVEALGGAAAVQDGYRLFMAPGMGHCNGGEGPNTFDMIGALDTWVEKGQAPDRIMASHATNGRVDRTRPLCPYPQMAVYTGSGSMDEAANFACKMPANVAADVSPQAAPPPMGRPVFDCYHINRAWGFFLGGNVIDDRGQMFAYRTVDRNAMPPDINEGGRASYDAAALLAKFQNRTSNGHIEKPMLDEQMALVQRAADGRVDLRDGRARDAGVSSCHAYFQDPETHRVRDVPLGSYGAVNDRVVTNSSDAAATLLGWLKAVRAAQ